MPFSFQKARRNFLKNFVYGFSAVAISPFVKYSHAKSAKTTITDTELENCLSKAISKFEVRDMLTKFGVPEDAEVTLKMQLGENSEPLARCSVPTTNKKDQISSLISWEEFERSIIDEFLNPALTEYSFSQYMPPDAQRAFVEGEMPLNIGFDSSYPKISKSGPIIGGCCRTCPPPAEFLCCFICRAK